ncbi:MAG: GlsB/YeaQ/YmgE family stress response membrane protein [Pseudomonadota bacterium]
MLFSFIGWLIVGGIAGWLASKVMKTGRPNGILTDIILGVIGAVIGGFLLSLLGLSAHGLIGSLVTAFIGAVALIWIVRQVNR